MTVKLNYPMYTLLERASYIRVYLKMEGYHLVGGTNNSGSQKVVFISAKWQLCIFAGSHIKINSLELYIK